MTVTVAEEDLRYRAGVPVDDGELPCCGAGHPDAAEAARHAWRLTRAIARKSRTLMEDLTGGDPHGRR